MEYENKLSTEKEKLDAKYQLKIASIYDNESEGLFKNEIDAYKRLKEREVEKAKEKLEEEG